MTLKACWKLHKVFVAEVERCRKLDQDGEKVLSSLANVSKRVPLITDSGTASTASSTSQLGVLSYLVGTPDLLLQKHVSALENSVALLRDLLRDLVDAVRRLRGYVDEVASLVDAVTGDDVPVKALRMIYELQEWMENVRTMFERDVVRKRLLIVDMEYHDAPRLQRLRSAWPAGASLGFVDEQYVKMGIENLPPLPPAGQIVDEPAATASTSETSTATAKKKKKKKKKTKSETQNTNGNN